MLSCKADQELVKSKLVPEASARKHDTEDSHADLRCPPSKWAQRASIVGRSTVALCDGVLQSLVPFTIQR